MRKIFNQPIRKETTEAMFPDKMSVSDFVSFLESSLFEFEKNMRNLDGIGSEEKYIEEWVEQFLAWNEVEEET